MTTITEPTKRHRLTQEDCDTARLLMARQRTLKEIAERQIAEVSMLITQLRDAVDVAERCRAGIAVVSAGTAARAARNLEDLRKRFLVGLAREV